MSYEIFGKDLVAMMERVNALLPYETSVNFQYPIAYKPELNHIDNDLEGYNLEYYYLINGGTYNKLSYNQCKIIPKEGVRLCGVLYDCKVFVNNTDTGETIKTLAVVGNGTSNVVGLTALFDVHEVGAASQQSGRALDTDNNGRNVYSVSGVTQNWRTISFETIGESYTNIETSSDTVINGLVDSLTPNNTNELKAVFMGVKNGVAHPFVGATTSTTRFVNNLWFVDKKQHACAYTITKYPFPIFESDKITQIVDYLNTGNDTGSIDPFDTNPKKKSIDDFRTNYRVFLSAPSDKSDKTHFNVIAYNNEYMQNRESLTDYYALKTWHYTGEEMLSTPNVNYPQNVWDEKVIHVVNPDRPEGMHLYLQFLNVDYPSFHSTTIDLKLNGDTTRECNCYVHKVSQGTTDLVKSQITDGYRYTNTSTGEFVDVLFRQATIKDLNDEYSIIPDDEDETTGEDQASVVGAGFRTFIIDNTKFNTINKKLWSTDWSQVFKSNTIDPIKCVIACKSIPFSATAGANDTVIIANLDTGVQANTCNPVKTFTIGTFEMPTFNGDFTDIEHLRIRCYLPYIGWIELPASECMSRRAWPDQGLLPNIKKLTFKYIVDFINGDCRCIIAVNGTERFFFDGHCDVNIPMTSDNHTNAVANAIKSGVETVLSVGAAVAGAYTGNAMAVAGGAMGAISNAADMIPTYTYSASCSPSGYINASMNTHIMIIFERPNVQKPDGYEQKFGRPCMRNLNLGSCRGYTQCSNANVSGINATPQELEQIKSQLESGVYL